jgi:hypothetical protein
MTRDGVSRSYILFSSDRRWRQWSRKDLSYAPNCEPTDQFGTDSFGSGCRLGNRFSTRFRLMFGATLYALRHPGFVRSVKTCDTALKGALSPRRITKTDDSTRWQITVSTVPLRLEVTEKIEPIPDMLAPPGGRRPRRPTRSLVVSLTAGYQQTATMSDKRGPRSSRKCPSIDSSRASCPWRFKVSCSPIRRLSYTWIMHTDHPSERWPCSADATSCVSKSV